MEVNMNDKYASRDDPYTEVKILCVDRGEHYSGVQSVVGLNKGLVVSYRSDGTFLSDPNRSLTLLKRKLREVFIPVRNDGELTNMCYSSEGQVDLENYGFYGHSPYTLSKFVEVVE